MEEIGVLRCVITQNVDGLHQAAGSRRVVELHGNLRHARCVSCGQRYPIEAVSEASSIPRCDRCHDLVKPGVVLFGESLPSRALEEAFQEAKGCGLLMVIGSSLEVSPANRLPGTAKASGARLAVANRTPTPADGMADYVYRDEAGEVLSRLLGFLEG
jgi:NAD-dependent deacetylase